MKYYMEQKKMTTKSSDSSLDFAELQKLVDELPAGKKKSPSGFDNPASMGGERYRAIIDLGDRARVLLENNGELLKELKQSCRGARIHVQTRGNYIEMDSEDNEMLAKAGREVREIIGFTKTMYVPDHWKDHGLREIEDYINENLGCQINTQSKQRGQIILMGQDPEAVQEAIDYIADNLKNFLFNRYPRFLQCVKSAVGKKLDAIDDLKWYFHQERPTSSPFVSLKGPTESVDEACELIRVELGKVQLQDSLGVRARLIGENEEFKSFCLDNNVETYYRAKRNRIYYHTLSEDMNQQVADTIESINQRLAVREFADGMPGGIKTALHHRFGISLRFQQEGNSLVFDPTSANIDDVFSFIDNQFVAEAPEVLKEGEIPGRIPIGAGYEKLLPIHSISEQTGVELKAKDEVLIIKSNDQDRRSLVQNLLNVELDNIYEYPFDESEMHVLLGHKIRRLFVLARDCGLDGHYVAKDKILIKGNSRAKQDFDEYYDDLKKNIVKIPVPGPIPIHMWSPLEAECDVYATSWRIEDQWYLIAADKDVFSSGVDRTEDIKSRINNSARFANFVESCRVFKMEEN